MSAYRLVKASRSTSRPIRNLNFWSASKSTLNCSVQIYAKELLMKNSQLILFSVNRLSRWASIY